MVSSGRGLTSPEPAASGAGEEEELGNREDEEPQKRRERRRHSPGVAAAVKGIDWRLKRGVEAEVVDCGERREEMDKGRLKSVCRGVVMAKEGGGGGEAEGCCIIVAFGGVISRFASADLFLLQHSLQPLPRLRVKALSSKPSSLPTSFRPRAAPCCVPQGAQQARRHFRLIFCDYSVFVCVVWRVVCICRYTNML